MELIANRPLTGTDIRGRKYRADPGQTFSVAPDHANKLIRRGLASRVASSLPDPQPQQPIPPLPEHDPIQEFIRRQTAERKAVEEYENKAITERKTKRRGRPGTQTACPSCGRLCRSARAAKEHCK